MTTGNRAYDEVIGAVDPFDAARFPVAVYESSRVLWTGSGADIEGHLTLCGVTKAVALSASYVVGRRDDRMVVRAGGTVDREAFGLRFDVPGVGKLIPGSCGSRSTSRSSAADRRAGRLPGPETRGSDSDPGAWRPNTYPIGAFRGVRRSRAGVWVAPPGRGRHLAHCAEPPSRVRPP